MSRVSSDEQAKGYSLDIQSEALEKYCERNDIEIVYSFREDHSAKNFDRPAFKEFMQHAKRNKGSIDLLLFTTWDRFSRNIMDAYQVIDQLKNMNITPQAIEQPIDLSIPENKLLLAMYLAMPEIDNDRRSIKVRGGIRAALKAGRWCGRAPFGYRNTRDENNRPLIIPNEHSDPIRIAFKRIASGIPQSVVRKELNDKGVLVKKSRFSEMLKNPMYMGKIKVPSFENEPFQLVEGVHQGIVSETTFHQVQKVLKSYPLKKRISSSVRNEALPLRGILKCTSCGGKLTGSRSRSRNGSRHAYYHCNHCRKQRFRADTANETMTEVLNGFAFSQSSKIIYKELVKRLLTSDQKENKSKARKLRETVGKQEERIERLQDHLADGIISSADFVQMKNRFSDMKRNAIEDLASMEEDTSGKSALLKKGVQAISGLGNFYSKAEAEAKIRILGSIFPEMIEFDGEKCRTTKINEAVALCLSVDKGLSVKKNRTLPEKLAMSGWVPGAGVEPARPQRPQDFKSCVSTNSTIRAQMRKILRMEDFAFRVSEKRDSNPRPRPWQGRALPTELFSRNWECKSK